MSERVLHCRQAHACCVGNSLIWSLPLSPTSLSLLQLDIMGLLSCFAPLLPARSTAYSTASTTTLVDKDAQHFVEGKSADEDRVVVDTGGRLEELRRELDRAEVDA